LQLLLSLSEPEHRSSERRLIGVDGECALKSSNVRMNLGSLGVLGGTFDGNFGIVGDASESNKRQSKPAGSPDWGKFFAFFDYSLANGFPILSLVNSSHIGAHRHGTRIAIRKTSDSPAR
jgi:hypothetical protein